ncbi:protein DBF4 homolog A isoform X3 [Myotis myotis]|uniref:protein DBF4 homolog A isoform X3 n=1 Tax=Myotis myotis TaxID=51298 RepID=UPI00174ABAC1|nr:protein DBF4 homolog A isoform X3 [Myotis myotis]
MNPGAMRIHSKGYVQGGIQLKNEKNRPSLKSLKTLNKPEKSKCKPLWGKIFYIDLPSVTISEKLQKDIKDLGGRVEEFLSKDISYLISNKKEAKFAQTFGQISPVPSPESAYTAETTSPHPSHDGSSFKSPDSVCLSRGKLLAEKAIKDHDFIPSNSILSNALSWGVKIIHIDDIRYYIEQKKKELCLLKKSSTAIRDLGKRVGVGIQKTRTGRLKKPFLKVEDMSQLYRPFYLQLTNMPYINYSIQKPSSPFDIDKPSNIQKQTQVKLRIQMDGDKCDGIPTQLQLKEKKKKGYCECCLQKYEDLETHLLTEQHRNFAQSNHYQVVDNIVSKLVFEFVEHERDMPEKKRLKYSVGSLSPITANILKKFEPKEKLELQPISQKDFRENNVQVIKRSFLYKETQQPEEELVFISEHISSPSDELRGLVEKTNQYSTLNPAENDIKQNFTHLFPAKDLKEKDLHLICHDYGLSAVNSSQEHRTIQANTPSRSCLGEPNECDIKNMDSLPSGKICRKVKILLRRNKKENLEPNVDLDKKRTECLITQEENRICSSQSLLDLFQTSEETSEFFGFTSYTENGGICDGFDIWREDDSNLSSLFSSFPSNSTFTGF